MTEHDKQHFITIARGSTFESVAILDLLHSMKIISEEDIKPLYPAYESISKMLLAMYRSYSK